MINILAKISKNKKKPLLAVLIDPDKYNAELILKSNNKADFYLIGGSSLKTGQLSSCLSKIKKLTKLPVLVFPGDINQLDKRADATLLLSLISGRNADYLIGKHVDSAFKLIKLNHEIIPTGYILLDGGKISTTQKVTKTRPVSVKNLKLIKSTAIAGELLGMKMIYLEAGSGALKTIPVSAIKAVKKVCKLPLWVGGGIDSIKKYNTISKSGADVIVIGNALEKNLYLMDQLKNN